MARGIQNKGYEQQIYNPRFIEKDVYKIAEHGPGLQINGNAYGNRFSHTNQDALGDGYGNTLNGQFNMNGTVDPTNVIDPKKNGEDVEVWPDGSKYIGQYVNGKKEGKGKFYWAEGSIYEGDFKNNNLHGKGRYCWSDGREYEGDWDNNVMHGKGVFRWNDGRKYDGDYVNYK